MQIKIYVQYAKWALRRGLIYAGSNYFARFSPLNDKINYRKRMALVKPDMIKPATIQRNKSSSIIIRPDLCQKKKRAALKNTPLAQFI